MQPDGSEVFSSYRFEYFIRHVADGHETVAILGRANRLADGSAQIVLEVNAKEAIRFAVENLDGVSIMRDGRPITGSQRQSGTFTLTLVGRPTQDTPQAVQ